MFKKLKSLRAFLPIVLLLSTQLSAQRDFRNDRWQNDPQTVEDAKKAYTAKWQAQQENRSSVSEKADRRVETSCSEELPKPKKRCVNAKKVIAHTLCAGDATVNDLTVRNNTSMNGDLTVSGDTTLSGQVIIDKLVAGHVETNLETADVSYETVNVVQFPREWQSERFVTPDYDRFPNGALPEMTKIAPGESYAYMTLTDTTVPTVGNDWSKIVRGVIDFETATNKEKLTFYSGAQNQLITTMQDGAFFAQQKEITIGAGTLSTVMPADQQKYAAQAMGEILKGLETINSTDLSGNDRVILFNLITQARFYIIAWNAGNTLTRDIGSEYFGSPNPAVLSSYPYSRAVYPPFISASLIIAYGFSSDALGLVEYARTLPGTYKLFSQTMDNWIAVAEEGLTQGFYPHVLRSRPFSSAGESTFGELSSGYSPSVVDLVQSGNFTAFDDSRLLAQDDYDTLLNASFEDQLSPNLLFRGNFTVEGLNPKLLLDFLVEKGAMDQVEADYIQEEARRTYDTAIKPSLLKLFSSLWLDEASPLVRALRLTRHDDFPGEWGYKFIVNTDGNVQATVNEGPLAGQTVFVDPLGEEVVILDAAGQPVAVNLSEVTLQRDEAAGDEHYANMAEIVLKLSRTTPIPFYEKVSTTPGVNPFENWQVQFDTTSAGLPEKLFSAGESLGLFFGESIDYYLDQWVTETFAPQGEAKTWQQFFTTQQEAIDAIKVEGRFTAGLEDPANGGIYLFVQHYKPIADENGPLYDFAQIEAYYTEAWDGVPFLKLTPEGRIDGPPVLDREGNVLYDPQALVEANGLINVDKLFAASEVDVDKVNYYRFLSATEIVGGKSARIYYFMYDFIKGSYEQYLTIGQNPLLNYFFSPYIVSSFNQLAAHRFSNSRFASGASYDIVGKTITYTDLINYPDPRTAGLQDRTVLLHEFVMGHALQTPLIDLINSTGTSSWLSSGIRNPATSEGWAVFIEAFFGPAFTSYLSAADRYWNYTDATGKPDPITMVPSITETARVAARLKWDAAVHSSSFKATLAEHAEGFEKDTFGAFPMTSEVSQRIPTSPTQGLNYGLGFLQIVGLFQNLPTVLGQERYDELQANGNKATKYFFDLMLIDSQGYFISSLESIYNDWADRVKNRVAPFDNPDYDGYPADAFDAEVIAYVPGTNPAAYEQINNPYVQGGFTFEFPACPVSNNGTCPLPDGQ